MSIKYDRFPIREHPFNLKGGYGFCLRGNFLWANLMDTFFLSLTWAEKHILFALRALKNIDFVEENKFCCAGKRKKYFYSEKKHSPPHPFKLNGWSLTTTKLGEGDFLSANLMDMGRKTYSVCSLGLKKYCFCRKKNSATVGSEKNIMTPNKIIAPHPL